VLAGLYTCYSAKEIGEMYSVKESTVRSWVHQNRAEIAREQALLEERRKELAKKDAEFVRAERKRQFGGLFDD